MGSGEIFTVLFVTLGPMNVIKLFAWLSKDADPAFQRQLAVRAFLIATVALVLSAFVGTLLVGKSAISIGAIAIGGAALLFPIVVYTYPASADIVRLISARRATASEKRQYYREEG